MILHIQGTVSEQVDEALIFAYHRLTNSLEGAYDPDTSIGLTADSPERHSNALDSDCIHASLRGRIQG